MTRRELLLVSSAAVLKPAEPAFERIDTHNHIHQICPELVAAMKSTGWRGLSICDSRAIGDEPSILNEMRKGTIEFSRASAGRWAWATTFDARGFESPEFASRVTADLERDFDRGAVAVKLWKNVGIAIRSTSGEYLMPDSPALAFVFDLIQRSGKTLITHLADPDQAWLPLDPNNPDRITTSLIPNGHFSGAKMRLPRRRFWPLAIEFCSGIPNCASLARISEATRIIWSCWLRVWTDFPALP